MTGLQRPASDGIHRPEPAHVPFFPIVPESSFPIIPSSEGNPFTIGFGAGCDVVLRQSPLAAGDEDAKTCATIYWTSEGWIVVEGTLDEQGQVKKGPSDVVVNGTKVDGYSEIKGNDVLRIADNTFVFVDPHKMPAVKGHALELGEPWLRRLESDGNLAAAASFRGIIDKYAENQDRAFFQSGANGLVVAVADGMGGHASGERAAEIARLAFHEALHAGANLCETINAMNRDIYAANRARHEQGGAVFAGVHLHNDGRIEVRTVGDSEVFVMSLSSDRQGPVRLDYWSTRPSHSQIATFDLPTLSDGRVVLGSERILRLDPDSNIVDRALGLRDGSTERYQEVDWFETELDRIYFAIPMTDGMSEQYASHQEIVDVVQDYVNRTGDVSPDGICDALLRDALIRCSLARMAYRVSRPFEISPEVFEQAYREMMFEMEGDPAAPPIDLPAWRYQSRELENGKRVTYGLVPAGGTAYVVEGSEKEGEGWTPDPNIVNPLTGRMRGENPALDNNPKVVCRFKQDNISLAVTAFVRTES